MFFVMIGVGAAIGTFGFIYWMILLKFSSKISRRIKENYLAAILKQETGWFDSFNYNELSARITKETMAINKAIGEKMGLIIFSLGMTICGLIIGAINGWSLALANCAIGPIIGVCAVFFGSTMESKFSKALKAYGQSAGYAEQALSAIKVVVAFGMEPVEITNYSKYLSRSKEMGRKQQVLLAFSIGCFIGSIFLSYSYAFWVGGIWIEKRYWNHILDRAYMGGDILAVFWGILFGFFALAQISPHAKNVSEGRVAGKFTYDVIERIPLINQDSQNGKTHTVQGTISFQDVQFYYPTRTDTTVLNNFSCTFEKGKTTAIVGPSGSGKSTIVQLLLRFYDPIQGHVLIDGERLDTLKLRAFRKQIGYVSQEPILFNCSIKENILLGCPEATDDEIIEALKMANAWDFVDKYPQKLDTNVGAGGGQLSGGQKQRIALARAIIKKPKILIFDEATSALDKKNEAEVQKAINTMKKNIGDVTTISIAHRLSTIKEADRILVLKKGAIVEDGNHDYLLKTYPNGVYAKLVSQQENLDEQTHRRQSFSAKRKNEKVSDHHEGGEVEALMELLDDEELLNDPDYLYEKAKMREADEKDKIKDAKTEAIIADVYDKKKQKSIFSKKLNQYNKPIILSLMGCLFAAIIGCCNPVFGALMIKAIFVMLFLQPSEYSQASEKMNSWVVYMLILAGVVFCSATLRQIFFGYVGENITENIRKDVYQATMRKHMGWHDIRTNNAGVINAVLAGECTQLQGITTEQIGVILECVFSLGFAIAIGFYFSWPMALIALCLTPLTVIGSALTTESDQGIKRDEKKEESDLLASDAIANFRTVASFACDEQIMAKYRELNEKPF